MPNYCGYSMRVKGSKESILKMDKIINADYTYGDNVPNEPHLFRVWNHYESELKEVEEGVYKKDYAGDCAWSIWDCMGRESYYNKFKDKSNFNGKSLLCCSTELDLEIECLSEEVGMGFEEYFYTDPNGKEIYECNEFEYDKDDEDDFSSRPINVKFDEFIVL